MKLYQKWLIGELGATLLAASGAFAMCALLFQWFSLNWFWLSLVFLVVFINNQNYLFKWFHRGTSMEDKFYRGGDDV